MPTITICASANFYKKVIEVQSVLEKQGFKVLIPKSAEKMKQDSTYDAAQDRTWLDDANDYHRKTALIRSHFEKIAESNAILVVNEEKNGIDNYIGGNVLMEMAVAFHLGLPIYIMNDVPKESKFLEEILALESIPLYGDLNKIEI